MLYRNAIASIALAATLCLPAAARAHDETKYPNLKGQWSKAGDAKSLQWDPGKPAGRGQEPPLTAPYRAIWEASLAKDANAPQSCLPPGMPRSMIGYEPIEIIIMPDTTYVMITYMSEFRRIFTDGRKWPDEIEPSFAGYSIGQWIDENGDGKYDVLAVETRGMKGPRTFDGSGIPMHEDNATVVKERIYIDKGNPNLLRDEVTTIDNALSRPWTVTRSFERKSNPVWDEYVCAEENRQVQIGKENYTVSDDGYLQPTRKDQPAPDLRYFNPIRR
jgi:hypothetical protein